MNKEKLRILMKTFIDAQFNYCPLIWMFHSRTLNNKINKLHERALRLVYKDYISSFENLLNIDNTFTIHERNLQKLATEKIKNTLQVSSAIFSLNLKIHMNYVIRIFARQKTSMQYFTVLKQFHSEDQKRGH